MDQHGELCTGRLGSYFPDFLLRIECQVGNNHLPISVINTTKNHVLQLNNTISELIPAEAGEITNLSSTPHSIEDQNQHFMTNSCYSCSAFQATKGERRKTYSYNDME
jgi:hypothetical protein